MIPGHGRVVSPGYGSRSFARALGIKIPEPYPLTFPRMLDFIPLHSIQVLTDPLQELFVYAGNVSIPLEKVTDKSITQNKDHTITITQDPSSNLKTAVKFGDPDGEIITTQEELWDEVQDMMGIDEEGGLIIPELSTRLRGLRNPVPYEVSDHVDLEGMEYLFQIQSSRGNRTRSYRERLGLDMLTNPGYIIRNELKERELWKADYGRYMKSILRTETILAGGDRGRIGWTELYKMPAVLIRAGKKFKFPPLASSLNRALSADKWSWDYGIPMTGELPPVGAPRAVVYSLVKRNVIVAI